MIKIIDEYLTEDLWNRLQDEIQIAVKSRNFTVNNFGWDMNLVHNSAPVLLYSLQNNQELFDDLINYDIQNSEYIKNTLDDSNHSISKMIYFGTNGSFITWHCDAVYKWASSLYLNKEWHHDWGGYFMYNDEIPNDGTPVTHAKAAMPVPNRLIEQSEGVMHSTTDVRHGDTIPFRISLQTFITENP